MSLFKKKNDPISIDEKQAEDKFVAFLDILGFSSFVKTDYSETIKTFNRFVEALYIYHEVSPKDVSLQIYSDSFVLTSKDLNKLIKAVQLLLYSTLFENLLVRGGIGFGKHLEIHSERNTYMISQPLVYAAEIEKAIKFPCVSFHESVQIPNEYWHPQINNFLRPVLFYKGITLVNPFNQIWGTSAKTRVKLMLEDFPEHSEKYNWFIELFEDVFDQKPLYPKR